MKNYYLISLGLLLMFSCSKNDPIVKSCTPTKVTYFDKSNTSYLFESGGANGQRLKTINVYENTDSATVYQYTYSGSNISKIEYLESGVTTTYTTSYDGDKISKLTAKNPDTGLDYQEIRFIYSGSNVTSTNIYLGNAKGTLFQIGHSTLTYNSSGDLTKSEINLDFVAAISILFGTDPTSYEPTMMLSTTYEPSNSPNPLHGTYSLFQSDLSLMPNLPASITITSGINGTVISSDSYTITNNEEGYPISAVSGSKKIEATYNCQ